MFVAIAIHHAAPEHVEDFVAFMGRVVEAVGHPPGLIDFDGYRALSAPDGRRRRRRAGVRRRSVAARRPPGPCR